MLNEFSPKPMEPVDRVPLGSITVGRTAYLVYHVATGEHGKRAGIVAQYALEGPRGATYYVTDYGPTYRINSIACGGARSWAPSPVSLRGLTREHFTAFREA